MADLQIFTSPKHKTARKAERFFKERGVRFHAVNVLEKPPAPGELRKWVDRFGVQAVLDKTSKTYVEAGLQYFSAGPDDWIQRMCRYPGVISLPLVRYGKELSVGDDPESWGRFASLLKS
ncbi:MAG: arsenate reductase family protein [Euzebya sp.]